MSYNYKSGVSKLVGIILAQGCTISVFNGQCYDVKRSTKKAEIVAEIMACDEIQLKVRDSQGVLVGLFCLVDNGTAEDIISDCSDNSFCEKICNLYEDMLTHSY